MFVCVFAALIVLKRLKCQAANHSSLLIMLCISTYALVLKTIRFHVVGPLPLPLVSTKHPILCYSFLWFWSAAVHRCPINSSDIVSIHRLFGDVAN